MRKRFGQSLRIGVARDAVALTVTSRWGGTAPAFLAELPIAADGPGALGAIGAGVDALLAASGCAGWPATLVLADDLARLWHVVPPQGAARLADLEGAAALRFQALYGEPASGWQIAADYDCVRPFVACALPRQLLAACMQASARQRITLVEIVPQFVAALNGWRGQLKPDAWFGLVHGGVLTLGARQGGVLQAVRATPVAEGADLAWLATHVAREALRLNLAAPARLQLAGDAPAAWNNRSGEFACSVLGAAHNGVRSPAARLALTGWTS